MWIRPSTFLPTDVRIEENSDGSKTVWCGEVERMCRTKGAQGFTLYPDKAYLAIKVRLFNRTPFPQTFLWWANPAVVVHEHYYSVFPPDVNAVYDHGKRDVTEFPISHGVYYKHNYAPGTDISRYINIPVPTSYMAVLSKYDFVGGYEENVQGGLLHIANHHVSPGKKQWTWGNGDFGRAWDRNLTDKNGPYIELMTGMYCDNQPDFSWLQPYEERTWTQYFMPYAEVGMVKNANKDVLLHFSLEKSQGKIIVYTTSEQKSLHIQLKHETQGLVAEWIQDISPEKILHEQIQLTDTDETHYNILITDEKGREMLCYTPEKKSDSRPVPDPAKPQRLPQDIQLQEQLYLTGLHLEQYRHATYLPEDYYLEALRRDPGDIRCNNAMGLLMLRRGKPEEAEKYLRKAIETMTERNPNPYDGEPYYNLGVALKEQNKLSEALDSFWKSTWNAAWQDAAFFMIARIETMLSNYQAALEAVERSLARNAHNTAALHLKTALLRHLGCLPQAEEVVNQALQLDPMHLGCRYEKSLLKTDRKDDIFCGLRLTSNDILEYSFEYAQAGLTHDAAMLIRCYLDFKKQEHNPIVYYALADYLHAEGLTSEADAIQQQAASMPAVAECFPNKTEEVTLLKNAISRHPEQAKAYYYLGNFYYSKRMYKDAQSLWEKSVERDATFPTVWRNLALVYYNKINDKPLALKSMERAFELDTTDARVFMELYQLYKKLGYDYEKRMALLEKHMALVEQRDDMMVEYVQLLNQTGKYQQAFDTTMSRRFHPWEGGEGKITTQYKISLRCLAKQAEEAGNYQEALDLLEKTESYPQNLGEGKLETMLENDLDYLKACLLMKLGRKTEAEKLFQHATQGQSVPQQAFYYNDSQPDLIYYQALAWEALGDADKANELYDRLMQHGKQHLTDSNCRIDYFAVSLPELAIWEDNLDIRNKIHCLFVIALAHLGKREKAEAKDYFQQVLQLDINHQSAQLLEAEC